MADIGSELRWVLLIFSIVLIAGLYIAGRWGRRQSADAVDSNISREARRESREMPARSFASAAQPVAQSVPQLDEVMSIRERHVEPPLTILPDTDEMYDDLPDVRVDNDYIDDSQLDAQSAEVVDHQLISMQADARALGQDRVQAQSQAQAQAQARAKDEAVKRPSTRKIIALRLVSGARRFDGGQLKDAFETAKLHHGKYDIYHRCDEQEVTMFSVASMVEPGTFDPSAMHNQQFQGVMVFAQLPGPMDGVLMFEQMLEFAERISNNLGGAIQDERGAVLTPQRASRIRDEIEDFQHLVGSEPRVHRPNEGIAAS
jgi:cell division protein ZipA